ncbi:MAG: hypothetical protein PUB01_05660 [Desulfovibrionaceae bacterium]|nr:hypothetical protein [Desulfovibrionaceae bacterium]
MSNDTRIHNEALGQQWAVLVGDPRAVMDQIVGTVLHEGRTRAAWQFTNGRGQEHVLMAWPPDQPVRAGVLMAGEAGKNLRPRSAMPILEGLPNDLTVEATHAWHTGVEGDVAVTMLEGKNPMWFYTPTFYRDAQELTPGVTHTFVLAGLAYGLRKALVDDMTITQGPRYEAHCVAWLAANPGKSRTDVPPLKVRLAGRKMIMPGQAYGEYQIRTTVQGVESCRLDKADITMLRVSFEFEDRPPLQLMIYVPSSLLGDYQPAEGDEIEAYVWLQGRIIDFDPTEDMPQ